MSNRPLHREQTVVSSMARGLELVLEMKKYGLAAVYLHRELSKEASEEDAALHKKFHEDLKEITPVNVQEFSRYSCLGPVCFKGLQPTRLQPTGSTFGPISVRVPVSKYEPGG